MSETLSERWAQHQRRLSAVEVEKKMGLARVEAVSDLIAKHTAAYSAVRDECLRRWNDASSTERIALERDIEHIESKLRCAETVAKATNYLNPPNTVDAEPSPETKAEDEPAEISGHWLDTFTALAKNRNEGWRQELLARALAAEASAPGTVVPRVVLLIGTLEERVFQYLGAFTDISVEIGGDQLLPSLGDGWDRIYDSKQEHYLLPRPVAPSHIVYVLASEGFLSNGQLDKTPQDKDVVYYTDEMFVVQYTSEVSITGMYLSVLGKRLVKFHDFKSHPLGNVIMTKFMDEIRKHAVVTPRSATTSGNPPESY
jgi:hypothetical protein